jgi:hypothetical protein
MNPFPHNRSGRRRRGQVAIFLLMLLTSLAFVLLWNVDLHRIITSKTRSQNAGDSAALAAARWQGISLNLVGELNLLHALALSARDTVAVDAITNIQARVLFTGPLLGLAAAQVAAKNNGQYANSDFSRIVLDRAQLVRSQMVPNPVRFPPPYADAWNEYADMLEMLARDGIAAGPDNTFFYGDSIGGHILKDKDFYEAIAGKTWCWFFLHHPTLLHDYTGYTWWPPLPPPDPQTIYNCEFLPLWLRPESARLNSIISTNALLEEAANRNVDMTGFIASNAVSTVETWYVYDTAWWGPWALMATDGDDPFPATGPVLDQYNYAGADASFRVVASVDRMTPGLSGGGARSDTVLWTAAAKAFGSLGTSDAPLKPTLYGLVLPGFSDVRLIPVDASSGSGNGAFDVAWRLHVDEHLPVYLAVGPTDNGCWYCQQLVRWEDPAFRQEGIDWLAVNSYRCTLPGGGGGGGGRGGGRRRGH